MDTYRHTYRPTAAPNSAHPWLPGRTLLIRALSAELRIGPYQGPCGDNWKVRDATRRKQRGGYWNLLPDGGHEPMHALA